MVTLGVVNLLVVIFSIAVNCRAGYGWFNAFLQSTPQSHSRHAPPGDANAMLGLAACCTFLALSNILLAYAALLSIRANRDGIRQLLTFVKIKLVLLAIEGILVGYWSWSVENDVNHPTLGATSAPIAFQHFLAIGAGVAYLLALYVVITKTPSLRRMLY